MEATRPLDPDDYSYGADVTVLAAAASPHDGLSGESGVARRGRCRCRTTIQSMAANV